MDKKQLIEEIASKIDDRDYSLILDLGGKFNLREREDDWRDKWRIVTIVANFDETTGNVGIAASQNAEFIDDLFNYAEEAWEKHMNTGEINLDNPWI
ncbi:hypothetical protein [Parasporobacterium paucivorans]|uniref:Uncharacterized protein n=1 Tax=Parasporobacterium paucivorans DSM 15970 TaxID=1122934 RepID=A0A1M6IPK1_9FIRM|nr:hypothetical protein [Parasporobacterium paucivorans]SHJ36363.1 hypothetical protein SAMN02745691_01816 [Parasporobacterium paucivorans DSM 15970]